VALEVPFRKSFDLVTVLETANEIFGNTVLSRHMAHY
jgi:hypothetical protein